MTEAENKSEVSKRILVIEPSRTIRAIFAFNVQQVGHQVAIFKDYKAAIAAFPRFYEQPARHRFCRPTC